MSAVTANVIMNQAAYQRYLPTATVEDVECRIDTTSTTAEPRICRDQHLDRKVRTTWIQHRTTTPATKLNTSSAGYHGRCAAPTHHQRIHRCDA